ncbi:MAG: DUF2179 domain-containing protein [Sedimentisphaerales bacterium]|nr:DUF2179 domain-containing protein [Sedimentisphaerales bacterium]
MIAALTIHSPLFTWVILPLLIFLSRIADVPLGTVRLIFVSRGMKYLAPLVGFFEVLIWILVIGQIMQHLSNPLCYVAYAGGFATGNFIGILVAEKLSLGMVMVRVITPKEIAGFVECLKQKRYGVTCVDGQGVNGPVEIVFTVVPRREVGAVVETIKKLSPQAFYTIEEVGFAEQGVFPIRKTWQQSSFLGVVRPFRRN